MIRIQRQFLSSHELNSLGLRSSSNQLDKLKSYQNQLKSKRIKWGSLLKQFVPITDWLLNYEFKKDLLSDVLAGVIIAIMNIPQGMAYALLASVAPIYGLYTSIFPVMLYCIFGPSKHISMGTNPLTSILTAHAIEKYVTANSTGLMETQDECTNIGVAISLTMMVSLWQILFSILRLGKLSWILSDVLVSGYTTGAAVHVLISQLGSSFGIKLPNHSHPVAKVFRVVISTLSQISETNWVALIITVTAMGILLINDELIKPRLQKLCRFPVPAQLIVVTIGTLVSYLFNFKGQYNVDTVGEVPLGLPIPRAPKIDLETMSHLAVDSLIIAIVGYCISLSLAKIFADKFDYKVDGNQELFSEGLSNLMGSFFFCIPSGASMSRSMVQVSNGGRTQLTSIVSIVLLIVVILVAGPLFECLPKAILSAIIIVALKGMLMQVYDLKKFAKRSKLDAALWVSTLISLLLMDIDSGLIIGVCLSLLLLVYRSNRAEVSEIGCIPSTSLFGKMSEFDGAQRLPNTILIKVAGPINFSNFEQVLEKLRKKLKRVPAVRMEGRKVNVIIDMANVPYIDQSAARPFREWMGKDLDLYPKKLAACNEQVETMLKKCHLSQDYFYPSLLDALAHGSISLPLESRLNSGLEMNTLTAMEKMADPVARNDIEGQKSPDSELVTRF